jgi:hypothetical protein
MNTLTSRLLPYAMLAAALCLSPRASLAEGKPAQPLALSSTPATDLEVLGDSTLHKWKAQATQVLIQASLAPGQSTVWDAVQAGALKALTLSAQVAGLKSTEGGSMDKNMHATMEADKVPAISFVMAAYRVKEGQVAATGVLSIHGVTKTVELKGAIQGRADCVNVKGSYDLLMSDYGVKAPVMMLGTVRVSDKVSIAYDFALVPAP